jgi:hypothetical protein
MINVNNDSVLESNAKNYVVTPDLRGLHVIYI